MKDNFSTDQGEEEGLLNDSRALHLLFTFTSIINYNSSTSDYQALDPGG